MPTADDGARLNSLRVVNATLHQPGTTQGHAPNALTAQLRLDTATLPELGPDIESLDVSIARVAPDILRVRITDARQRRYEVPPHLFPADSIIGGALEGHTQPSAAPEKSDLFEIEWDKNPFAFRVLRPRNGSSNARQTLWDSTGLRLIFKDQYIEITSWVNEKIVLYGAGERASQTLHLVRNGAPRTLWNHDLGPTFLEQNSYGSHPFVLALDPADGTAWGYFVLSSTGMDIIPAADRLSWRLIGGIVDIFILGGPTPSSVLDQLTRVVGRPAFMPYWALGWHQCKYGYKSVWEVEAVVANYSHAGIPLEAIWTDIDHMDRWMDFTFDPVNFPLEEMQRFVTELGKKGQKWIPIVDPGIKLHQIPGSYEPYDRGLNDGIFIRGHGSDEPYLGWVWPGAAVYPDFLHERGQRFLSYFLSKQHEQVPWSGIWIDMDEAANFCTGDACVMRSLQTAYGDDPPPWVCNLDCSKDLRPELNDTWRAFLEPPYQISTSLERQPLGTKAISVIATHIDGSLEYNAHNLYGLAQAMAAYDAVKNITGKRPFVLTRSTFTGSGAYAAHWSGDNAATWRDLALSLPAVLSYGLFGMPMAGVDVCGFQGHTTEELCARWVALAAVGYPFARLHSDLHSPHQEPYLWPQVAQTARTTLAMRYSLLPYWYTLHAMSHASGAPVARPLWFKYPEQTATHTIDRQFMIGEALLVTPVLDEGSRTVSGFFPAGTLWYNLFDDSEQGRIDARNGAVQAEIPAPLDWIPLHMAGGNIIPMQMPAMTTEEVFKNPLTLLVALRDPVGHDVSMIDSTALSRPVQRAVGRMYRDDGESVPSDGCAWSYRSWLAYELVIDSHTKEHHATLDISLEGSVSSFDSDKCPYDDSTPLLWPMLRAVKVLGWHLPLKPPGAVIEFSRYDSAESPGPDAVWTIPEDQVEWGQGQLVVGMPEVAGPDLNSLTRGSKMRVQWVAADRRPDIESS